MKTRKFPIKAILIPVSIVLFLAIIGGTFTLVYFLTEPDFVDLGEVAANKVINANAQVELGRLVEVPTTGAYDIMLFDGSFHCYAYVDKGTRFINGIQAFFTSFNMGLTESRSSVNVLVGNALLTDLPPFLVGTFVGATLSISIV